MASLLDAINAAAAALSANAEVKNEGVKSEKSAPRVQPRVQPKSLTPDPSPRRGEKVQPKQPTKPTNSTEGTAPKSQKPKTDTTKAKGQDFTGLFDGYLRPMIEAHLEKTAKADPAFAAKMKAKGKSIEGCLNYIGEHFYRQAEKQRKSGWVGIGGDDRELCGLAVHYYDESEESLKAELNGKS